MNVDRRTIEALLQERRSYAPPDAFRARARVKDDSIYAEAAADREAFWGRMAEKYVTWFKPFDKVLEWDLPFAKWFVGGKLNVSYNCLDRHVAEGKADQVAYHWEGEPGDTLTITYGQLLVDVCRFANALKKLGVKRGDRVGIYLPMIPELPVAMLACTRLGAPHSVVFGGLSAGALRERCNDAGATVVITSDEGWRRGSRLPLKENTDVALAQVPSVKDVVVVRRTGGEISWVEGRDHWWHELVDNEPEECEPEQMDSEDLLYLLYTSGTTAKPKGGIKHTTGGYLVHTAVTHALIFDIQPDTVYWCAAEVGWVTGHSYIVYSPLTNGCTSVMYEGTPDFPDKDRWWAIIEKYGVTVLYCPPTAIRTFMKWGAAYPGKHDLSSLRVLGTVGEPINPEAWIWYRETIGGGRCPVVDTWWQTETGGIMITPLPGVITCKPGSATRPFPGIEASVVDEQGNEVARGGGGYVVVKSPWPGMLRGIWGDDDRYKSTYWEKYGNLYFSGDGARIDEDGYFWFMGRVDDVMNINGHRISTTEVESALVDHPSVAEAAVIGRSDSDTGQAIAAFVTLRGHARESTELIGDLRDHVANLLGAIAMPRYVAFTPELPKTRSGKIMRRLLRDIAESRRLGDTTTLADPAVLSDLQWREQEDASKEE